MMAAGLTVTTRKHCPMGLYFRHVNGEMRSLSSEQRNPYIHKVPLPHLSMRYKKTPMDKKVVVVG